MKNSLKLLIAALAIGGTVAGTAAYAFSNRSHMSLEKVAYATNETSYSSSYFKLRYDYKSESHRVGLGSHNYFENGIDTNFTLVWNNSDSDSFYIKVGDQYINANQNSNEIQSVDSENAASKWTVENGAIKQGKKYLYFNPDPRYPRVSAYTIKDNYPIAYFYTPAEYANNISRCNWSSFAQECLIKIQYDSTAEPEPEPDPEQPDLSTKKSTLSFTAKCNGEETANDGAKWTVTSDGTESSYDSTKGIHYGTGSASVQYIKLTTSDIKGTITSIIVNASTASGVSSATVDVKVNGEAFGGNPQALTSNAANYTFNGNASGNIEVTITKPAAALKALYCKSITVTYIN